MRDTPRHGKHYCAFLNKSFPQKNLAYLYLENNLSVFVCQGEKVGGWEARELGMGLIFAPRLCVTGGGGACF